VALALGSLLQRQLRAPFSPRKLEMQDWAFLLVVLSAAERSGSSASPPQARRPDVWGDQALSRYPVLKIHAIAAMHTIKKAKIMTRLTPALISEVP
jgi:hypothetical protein